MPIAIRVTFTPARFSCWKISSRSFALNRWIRRNDDFVNIARVDASNEVRDAQLLRSDSVQWRNGSVQNMETPLKCFVFSIAAMLVGSSTTQTRRWLR